MLLKYRIKRLRNMGAECLRLIRVRLLSWRSIRNNWDMHSLDPKNSGMSWRPLELTYHMSLETAGRRPSSNMPTSRAFPGGYVERTENLRIPRDYLDVVLDFLGDYVVNFYHNIFITSRCNHPHQHVSQEWDGDEDVGYVLQHRCSLCRDYISGDDIDQYLPEMLRRPDLIMIAPMPVFMEDELMEDHELQREYADYD